tara:strand:+ start:4035 stop:4307 length:273 start_codon:yes stop_codon:yes gene_type:complete
MRVEKLAYFFYLVSSLILIGFFLNFGDREGYIVSEIKWTFFGLTITINLIFFLVSVWRFILQKTIKKKEIILTIIGFIPMITLLIYQGIK